ncbi:MAG: M36 family metallopeptidase [Deltaproteobacteria bacterium]|nr:M36 family metallopeptidase [Deltaproteobacteria bacterium]
MGVSARSPWGTDRWRRPSSLAASRAVAVILVGCTSSQAPSTPRQGYPVVHAPDPASAARGWLGERSDLRISSIRTSLGGQHVRLAQVASDGSVVAGSEVAVHLDENGPGYRVLGTKSNTQVGVHLGGSRVLDRRAVERAARTAVGADGAFATRILDIQPIAIPTDPGEARAGYRVVLMTDAPAHEWEVWVDGETGATQVTGDALFRADGKGLVFRQNATCATGDLTLTDDDDATSEVLDAARSEVTLQGLDGSGFLRGPYVDVYPADGQPRVKSGSFQYFFNRSDEPFEEVSAYFHLDRAQRHLQALGFTGPAKLVPYPIRVTVNATTDDSSTYSPFTDSIQMGSGGVDDAEDGDILLHEYGHAVLNYIIPGFGLSPSMGKRLAAQSIGEGFADILAASVPTGGPERCDRACLASWGGRGPGNCLRRVDGDRHYPEAYGENPHENGQIWSGAVWEMYQLAGLGPKDGLRLVIQSMFFLPREPSFEDSARALIAADEQIFGGLHVDGIRRALWKHGLLREPVVPPEVGSVLCAHSVLLEPPSPIGPWEDGSVTIRHAGAPAIRVRFAWVDMGSGCSPSGSCGSIYVLDGKGRLYTRLTGTQEAIEAPAVRGDTVIIRWVTGSGDWNRSFAIDQYEIVATSELQGDAGGHVTQDASVVASAVGKDAQVGDSASPRARSQPEPSVDSAPRVTDAGSGAVSVPRADASGHGEDLEPVTQGASQEEVDGLVGGCEVRGQANQASPLGPWLVLALWAIRMRARPKPGHGR